MDPQRHGHPWSQPFNLRRTGGDGSGGRHLSGQRLQLSWHCDQRQRGGAGDGRGRRNSRQHRGPASVGGGFVRPRYDAHSRGSRHPAAQLCLETQRADRDRGDRFPSRPHQCNRGSRLYRSRLEQYHDGRVSSGANKCLHGAGAPECRVAWLRRGLLGHAPNFADLRRFACRAWLAVGAPGRLDVCFGRRSGTGPPRRGSWGHAGMGLDDRAGFTGYVLGRAAGFGRQCRTESRGRLRHLAGRWRGLRPSIPGA